MFNPETESFTEGFYTMAKEKERRVAELEQEVKYWKEKSETLEKEVFKLKVKMNLPTDDKAVPNKTN
jgi:predicted  nucleic acid-binding Zn-ribbon protein